MEGFLVGWSVIGVVAPASARQGVASGSRVAAARGNLGLKAQVPDPTEQMCLFKITFPQTQCLPQVSQYKALLDCTRRE